jgi:hypothetical protein
MWIQWILIQIQIRIRTTGFDIDDTTKVLSQVAQDPELLLDVSTSVVPTLRGLYFTWTTDRA